MSFTESAQQTTWVVKNGNHQKKKSSSMYPEQKLPAETTTELRVKSA